MILPNQATVCDVPNCKTPEEFVVSGVGTDHQTHDMCKNHRVQFDAECCGYCDYWQFSWLVDSDGKCVYCNDKEDIIHGWMLRELTNHYDSAFVDTNNPNHNTHCEIIYMGEGWDFRDELGECYSFTTFSDLVEAVENCLRSKVCLNNQPEFRRRYHK